MKNLDETVVASMTLSNAKKQSSSARRPIYVKQGNREYTFARGKLVGFIWHTGIVLYPDGCDVPAFDDDADYDIEM